MKAPRAIGLSFSWPYVTAVLLIDVALLAVVTHWPGDPRAVCIAEWVGIAIAALVLIAAVLTYRAMSLAALLAAWLRNRRGGADRYLGSAGITAIDHRRRYGRGVVGIRESDGHLVSVIEVTGGSSAGGASSGLSVARVATGLRQFDVCLDGIDIVSIAGEPQVWVVLRMNAAANIAAVVVRDSVASTIAAAAERLAEDLNGDRCSTRILTAHEIVEFDNALLAGLRPEHLRTRLSCLEYRPPGGPELRVTNGWLASEDIISTLAERTQQAGNDFSVLTIKLVPGVAGVRISALMRHHQGDGHSGPELPGGTPLTGRQLAAVVASRPVPVARPAVLIPTRELDAGQQLMVPLGAPPTVPTEVVR